MGHTLNICNQQQLLVMFTVHWFHTTLVKVVFLKLFTITYFYYLCSFCIFISPSPLFILYLYQPFTFVHSVSLLTLHLCSFCIFISPSPLFILYLYQPFTFVHSVSLLTLHLCSFCIFITLHLCSFCIFINPSPLFILYLY